MKNKTNQNWKTNQNMLNKANYKKLDWLKIKEKHTSNATNKNKKIEESDKIT